MGRPKGWVMSEEHKQKLAEGRRKAREEKLALGLPLRQSKKSKKAKNETVDGKPVMYVTGKEKDAFDFVQNIRYTFRRRHDYRSAEPIVMKICKSPFWQNVEWLQDTLSEHFTLRVKEK